MISRILSASRAALGVDLGSANTRVVQNGLVLFDQPSLCCFKGYNAAPGFVAFGEEARSYEAKIAKPLKIIRPLEHGVLSDMPAAREFLSFARRSSGIRRLMRTRPVFGIPGDATQAERRALGTAAMDVGFLDPLLIAEPLLAARGLGLMINEPQGRMVVDCGAGTTDIGVISLGGLCVVETLRAGGLSLDRSIIDHLHLSRRFLIGPRSAEQLKLDLSKAFEAGCWAQEVNVRGSDVAAGLPRQLALPAAEFRSLWLRFVRKVAATVREALARCSPEIARDILDGGIYLTGGAAPTALLASTISEHVGVPVQIGNQSRHAVANGLASVIEERSRR